MLSAKETSVKYLNYLAELLNDIPGGGGGVLGFSFGFSFAGNVVLLGMYIPRYNLGS